LSAAAQSNNQTPIVYPTEEQLARYKRLEELLKHPSFVTLRLVSMQRDAPNEEPSTTPSPYTADQRIHFQLFITQNLTESFVVVGSTGAYPQYRPELVRDGDHVHYRTEVRERIAKVDTEPSYGSTWRRTLEPGREYINDAVSLEDWYDSPLKPGHYQLTVRKRFTPDGDWVESNPVTFDVVPRKPPTPIPEGFRLRLVPGDVKTKSQGQPYKLSYEAGLAVELINDSEQRVQISVIDKYYGHRPQANQRRTNNSL